MMSDFSLHERRLVTAAGSTSLFQRSLSKREKDSRFLAGSVLRNAEDRKALTALLERMQPNLVMAEIGVYSGESTAIFLESGRVSHLFAIDSWQDGYDIDGHDLLSHNIDMDLVEARFDERLNGFRSQVTKQKMTSLEAAGLHISGSLNFAYIDAHHSYESVVSDIRAWIPKIRQGGAIGGHDYGIPEVSNAIAAELGTVDEVFSDYSWLKCL